MNDSSARALYPAPLPDFHSPSAPIEGDQITARPATPGSADELADAASQLASTVPDDFLVTGVPIIGQTLFGKNFRWVAAEVFALTETDVRSPEDCLEEVMTLGGPSFWPDQLQGLIEEPGTGLDELFEEIRCRSYEKAVRIAGEVLATVFERLDDELPFDQLPEPIRDLLIEAVLRILAWNFKCHAADRIDEMDRFMITIDVKRGVKIDISHFDLRYRCENRIEAKVEDIRALNAAANRTYEFVEQLDPAKDPVLEEALQRLHDAADNLARITNELMNTSAVTGTERLLFPYVDDPWGRHPVELLVGQLFEAGDPEFWIARPQPDGYEVEVLQGPCQKLPAGCFYGWRMLLPFREAGTRAVYLVTGFEGEPLLCLNRWKRRACIDLRATHEVRDMAESW